SVGIEAPAARRRPLRRGTLAAPIGRLSPERWTPRGAFRTPHCPPPFGSRRMPRGPRRRGPPRRCGSAASSRFVLARLRRTLRIASGERTLDDLVLDPYHLFEELDRLLSRARRLAYLPGVGELGRAGLLDEAL